MVIVNEGDKITIGKYIYMVEGVGHLVHLVPISQNPMAAVELVSKEFVERHITSHVDKTTLKELRKKCSSAAEYVHRRNSLLAELKDVSGGFKYIVAQNLESDVECYY